MRYDFKNEYKETRNSNLFEMDVMELNYNYYDKEINDYQHFKAAVIARDARDAVRLIGEALPRGTKFNVESYDQRICTITGVSDIMKKKIYDFLKKEFETETKKGIFTKKK